MDRDTANRVIEDLDEHIAFIIDALKPAASRLGLSP